MFCRGLYISRSSKYSLLLKELEMLLRDIFNLLGFQVLFVGDKITDVLKKKQFV